MCSLAAFQEAIRDQVTIVVSTFDKYKESWPVYCHGMQKHWPDCPWRVVFTVYEAEPPCFDFIECPPEMSTWSMMMRYVLERIDTPLLLFMHDDYWMVEPPNEAVLINWVMLMMTHDIHHIQLCPSWDVMKRGDPYEHDNRLLWVPDHSDYRTSNQASLWRTGAYLDLLRDEESPWAFETAGSRRSMGEYNCLCVAKHDYFKYVYRHLPEWPTEPIVKGRWTKAAKMYVEQEGLSVDFSQHPGD